MATYNGARYIREQIDSILAQTIQDFELVICDDCSSDETFSILSQYAREEHRIRIIKNDKNLGFKKNFEKAIGLCSGDYIALSDQDDICMPNHLETLLSMIGSSMISCGNADLIDAEGNPIGLTLKQMEAFDKEYKDNMQKAYSLIFFRNPYQGASMLIKKEFFEKALPIPNEIGCHDSWFAVLSCFNGGLTYTEKIVNRYRMHGNNVTGMRTKRKSKIRNLIYQLIYAHAVFDRPAMLNTIRERITNLTQEEAAFIQKAENVLNRASSLYGRIRNTFFRISHFKLIYNCK